MTLVVHSIVVTLIHHILKFIPLTPNISFRSFFYGYPDMPKVLFLAAHLYLISSQSLVQVCGLHCVSGGYQLIFVAIQSYFGPLF